MASGCPAAYRARSPRATPLYRLFDAHFDEVKGQWEGRFERRYGFWRSFVDERVLRYLDCGLFENGFARIRCPECAEEVLLAFSCKTRELCPSCAAKRSAATAALLADEVLADVGHAQWVFVIPKMLRPYLLHHRELLGELARTAWETVLELMGAAAGAPHRDVPGTALCRRDYPSPRRASHNADAGHSTGSASHCGCSGSVGGRRRVISVVADHPASSRLTTLMARRWGAKGGPEGRSFRTVHNRVRVEPEDQPAVERLARYIMRPPISLERMAWDGAGEVRYRRKRGHESSGLEEREVEAFDPGDFLARVIMHIPEPRRHVVRYYGWYSNVSRGKRRKAEAQIGEVGGTEAGAPSRAARAEARNARALRRSWAQLIKRIYEVDPLVCPSCGSEMKVIAFITEHDVVDAILRQLKRKEKQEARGPPG